MLRIVFQSVQLEVKYAEILSGIITVTFSARHCSYLAWSPSPLPPLGHIWDVILVWRREILRKKLSLCYNIVYYYNGAQM